MTPREREKEAEMSEKAKGYTDEEREEAVALARVSGSVAGWMLLRLDATLDERTRERDEQLDLAAEREAENERLRGLLGELLGEVQLWRSDLNRGPRHMYDAADRIEAALKGGV